MKISFDFIVLHATGGHAGTVCMRLAATRVLFICDWPPVTCKFCMRQRTVVQSRQFFASTLREQLFELQNEGAI